MGTVSYGPALVSLMRGVVGRSVMTWAPPRAIIGKRKRGVRNRKVGRHSVPKLLARMDTIWRALHPSGKFALRRKAAANNYTNYVWFRRHVLNHQRRTGWKGPLALDLDTGYYIPMVDAAYAGGDVIELRWDDPDSSPRTMNLRSVAGQDCTMVQDAIHCEEEPPPPPDVEWTWESGYHVMMMPYWLGTFTVVAGSGTVWIEACMGGGCIWANDWVGEGGHLDLAYQPTMGPIDWKWTFAADTGQHFNDSGRDVWP